MLHEKELLGEWKRERILGSGGFGVVTQWRNKETNDTFAIKQCRLIAEHLMSSKLRRRWEVEVDIMKRLNHLNVVASRDVPEPLAVGEDEMPLMAMEYCTRGDLRRVLNRPENCCGLIESEVLTMTRHIASAVEYLHSMRIIHRDLKPENIVLQEVDNKIVYKLIDLGYAKELDQNSLCTSFVGTLHYLAPELFGGQTYTCTVDYWSFGLIVFECITGIRPFLPNESPYHWQLEVRNKAPEDICAYYDSESEGRVKFSKHLYKPNHINPILQEHFEKWLQLMFRWEPRQRGGILDENKRPQCFKMLDDIHRLMIAKVYCVHTNEILHIKVNENMTMTDLKEEICLKTNIPISDQELLLPKGISPDPNIPATQCCDLELANCDWILFVFQKSKLISSGINTLPLPELVQSILQDPQASVSYEDKKKMWSHAVYYCRAQIEDYKYLIQAKNVALMNLLYCNSALHRKKALLRDELNKLTAESHFFTISLQTNIDLFEKQEENGLCSEKMKNQWKSRLCKKKISDQIEIVKDLQKLGNSVNSKTLELQQNPITKSHQPNSLQQIEKDVLDEYDKLRRLSKEIQSIFTNNEIMVKFVARIIIERKRCSLVLSTHLEKLLQCKEEIQDLNPKLDTALTDVRSLSQKLFFEHRETQLDVWRLITLLQKQYKSRNPQTPTTIKSKSSPEVTYFPLGLPVTSKTIDSPETPPLERSSRNLSQSPSESYTGFNLSKLLEKSGEESLLLIQSNCITCKTLQSTFSNFSDIQEQTLAQMDSMDWSFLKDQNS